MIMPEIPNEKPVEPVERFTEEEEAAISRRRREGEDPLSSHDSHQRIDGVSQNDVYTR
jgi:hypothetical protein